MLIVGLLCMGLASASWQIASTWRFEMSSASNATYNFADTTTVGNLSGTDTLNVNMSGGVFDLRATGNESFNVTINALSFSLVNYTVESGLSTIDYNISGLNASMTFSFYADRVLKTSTTTSAGGVLDFTTTELGSGSVLHEFILTAFTCTGTFQNTSSCISSFMINVNETNVTVLGDGNCNVLCEMPVLNESSQVNTTIMDKCNYAIEDGFDYQVEDEGCWLQFHDMNITFSDTSCRANFTAYDVDTSCFIRLIEDETIGQTNLPAFNATDQLFFYNFTVVDE